MKPGRYCIGILVLLFSCGQPEEKPQYVLERETFVKVLTEMHRIEARVSEQTIIDAKNQLRFRNEYKALFARFGTDSTAVRNAFDYYGKQEGEMEAIYSEVMSELGKQ